MLIELGFKISCSSVVARRIPSIFAPYESEEITIYFRFVVVELSVFAKLQVCTIIVISVTRKDFQTI